MSTARTTVTVNAIKNENEIRHENEIKHETEPAAALLGTIAEPQPVPRTTPRTRPDRDHRLRWPEALAITVALLLGGAVAAGAFRPMLPWLG